MSSLREIKKEKTLVAIQEAALRLFEERGFGNTTVADIAELAQVSPRTVFSYGRSKEHLVFCGSDQVAETLREHLENREPGESTFVALRAWLVELLEVKGPLDSLDDLRRHVIAATPELQLHQRALLGEFERILAASIARDLGEDSESLRARMAAAATASVLISLKPGADVESASAQSALEGLEAAFSFLQAGLLALKAPATG
jgi:AcrR family transcriptional regulator